MKGKVRLIPERKVLAAMALSPGKSRTEVEQTLQKELGKRMKGILALSACFLGAAVMLSGETKEREIRIERPLAGEKSIWKELLMEGESGWYQMKLEVGALEYEEVRIEQLHVQTERYLDSVVPGENEGFSKVQAALYFPAEAEGFPVSWSTDAPWLVDAFGEVHNETLTEGDVVTITAKVFYGSEFRVYERQITVLPPSYTAEEKLLMAAGEQLSGLEQGSRTEPVFVLPETVLGRALKEETEKESAGGFLALLAIVLPMLVYQNYFSGLEERRKRREEQAKRSYSEFVTRLSLLMAAGVTTRQAFGRLAKEYERNYGRTHVLAEELGITWQEMKNGYSEQEAYETFGKRMGVLVYQRLASLLVQSVTKGVQGMREQMLAEAKEVMATERAEIRVRGEQAGTKLMLPMMGFLILVFTILLVPAFRIF